MKKTRTKYLRMVAWTLLGIVVLLDAAFLIVPDRDYSATENRNLQLFPTLTGRTLTSGRFESQFEDYVADQFPLRNTWIRLKTTVDRLMGRTESNGVFLAKDGYLIQNFTEPDAQNYQETVLAVRNFASWHGQLNLYMMVVPSALTVYGDKLPANAIHGDESAYIDRLYRDLSGSNLNLVDVRALFGQVADSAQLYYRTDHHWTTYAAYVAYRQLATMASLPGLATTYTPMLISDGFSGTLTASSGLRMSETDEVYAFLPENGVNHVVTYPGQDGRYASVYFTDNLALRDKYTVFFNGNHPQVNIETGAETKRVLLVLKDSYANCFVPYLIQDYKKIIMVDPRYYTGDLETLLTSEGVTDVLFLYNANTLATDTSLKMDL